MFGWISRSALPDPEMIDWLFDVYAWLLAETGGFATFGAETHLVLPTPEFFPIAADLEGDDRAQGLFAAVRRHARMVDWPCDLVAHDEAPQVRDVLGAVPHGPVSSSGPAGTFRVKLRGPRPRAEITYAPSGLADPTAFVATLAHELAHYLLGTFSSEPPGGAEAEEPATDVGAVFLGFGVFTANSAFRFQQFQDAGTHGWRTSRLGYLDERTLSYALGIFLSLHDQELHDAKPHLGPNPRSYTKNALLHIARERGPAIARLRDAAIRPSLRSAE
jgi:hypothetical protein